MIRAGSDIGGTFTDVILFDRDSRTLRIAKLLSSRELDRAVLDGIQSTGARLDELETLVHGSTVVINALLERKGVRMALVTTEGFRDVYEIGRINRPDSFNVFFKKHDPLVPRAHRLEVRERMLPDCVLTALDEDSITRLIVALNTIACDAVAITLLHSYANPVHEQILKARLAHALPGKFITASHELTREYREYERTSTTVANAYVGPIVDRYLGSLDRELSAGRFKGEFFLMQSNGGLLPANEARRNCIALIESGPAGGVIGTQQVLADLGLPSGVAFDMGGTTAKAGVVENGMPRIGHQYFIGSYNTGLPVLTPVMDIHEVGTGGGSIAVVTRYGELRVGPQSAGASPGPACYANGGTAPTVTDANVALGRLNAELPLAGALALDITAARTALAAGVADPLGIPVEAAASGVLRVANTAMAYAISAVTVERGLNPADFVLVAYGGAGPLHATQIARELGMAQVVIPPNPGVFSAYGMLFADPQGHASRTKITLLDEAGLAGLKPSVDEMIVEASSRIGLQGTAPDAVDLFADMRYVGQEHTVTVPIDHDMLERADAYALKSRFDAVHERTYAHSAAHERAQIVTLRCVVSVRSDKPRFTPLPPTTGEPSPAFRRNVWLDDEGPRELSFYARASLPPGFRLSGPAVVFEETSSTLLLEGDVMRVHGNGHLIIEIDEEAA